MMISEEHLLSVLELISRNDGAYGWYQLDRELVRQGVVGVHVGQALSALLEQGFVMAGGDPSQASSRYRITELGASFLERAGRHSGG